ncbi:prepilin peptidase [Microbacterium sp. PI-1]|uniref:prepilin peptidase n=1 Tax=unclassified Microbacterium TaxID=2609290 RepID=UPI00103E0EC9|nr:prepilin peptidase [Microbacterium sp. PI-1]TCJ21780.1 prepilin peptidase [Microbacterium sp. PI-1]
MTEPSTYLLEPAYTPRRSFAGPWTLISLSAAVLGLLLVAAAPVLGGTAYGWVVVAVTAVRSARLAVVDERTHTLPNRLTGALAVFGIIQAIGISAWRHDAAPLVIAGVTAGILASLYALLALTKSGGFGDIKFAGALALTIAPYAGLFTLYLLPIAFVISAVRIMARRVRGRAAKHPHGPSLAIAGIVLLVGSMLAGPALILA